MENIELVKKSLQLTLTDIEAPAVYKHGIAFSIIMKKWYFSFEQPQIGKNTQTKHVSC